MLKRSRGATAGGLSTDSKPRKKAPAGTAAPEVEPEDRLAAPAYVNKQRVLIFSGRGITQRYRHLMEDLRSMLPHHKTEAKLDSKDELRVIADIAEVKQCNNVLFFDVRKKRDCYLWMAHTPSGPSVKFHLVNVHTMDELRLTGNCLRGSRPLLSFDAAFDAQPHLQLLKEMFIQTFNTPQGHPKSQPFHDHIMSFFVLDNMVWVRHYQIVDAALTAKEAKKLLATGAEPTSLVEIGPRFVLNIVRIFKGAFGGPTLFTNPDFRSPNALRHDMAAAASAKHEARGEARMSAKARAAAKLPKDPLASVFTAGLPGEAAAGASDEGSSSGAASDSE